MRRRSMLVTSKAIKLVALGAVLVARLSDSGWRPVLRAFGRFAAAAATALVVAVGCRSRFAAGWSVGGVVYLAFGLLVEGAAVACSFLATIALFAPERQLVRAGIARLVRP